MNLQKISIALFTILVPSLITIFYEDYKFNISLDIMTYPKSELLNTNNPLNKDLKIFVNGKVISNLTIISFLIENSGNRPLDENDIKVYPTIKFEESIEIVKAEIVKSNPETIEDQFKLFLSKNMAEIKFNLLNPKDYLIISFLIKGELKAEPEVICRIKGIQNINRLKLDEYKAKSKFKRQLYSLSYPFIIIIFGLALIFATNVFYQNFLTFSNNLKNSDYLFAKAKNNTQLNTIIEENLKFLLTREKNKLKKIILDASLDFKSKKSSLVIAISEYTKNLPFLIILWLIGLLITVIGFVLLIVIFLNYFLIN